MTYDKKFEDWLLMGSWTVDNACMILAGFFPGTLGDSQSRLIRIADGKPCKMVGQKEYERILTLFTSDEHDRGAKGADGKKTFPQLNLNIIKGTVRPCYVINWAKKKRIDISWFEEAKNAGFSFDKPKAKSTTGNKEARERENTEMSDKKLENERRAWGHVLKVIKETHNLTQKEIITKIGASLSPDEQVEMKNKGLEERAIKDVFARANKVLEKDKNN